MISRIPPSRECCAVLVGIVLAGMCACSGGSSNSNTQVNENSFSLDDTISAMIEDIERARGCGDTMMPELTAEGLEAALNQEYAESDIPLTFEEFVLTEAVVFSNRADVVCGLVFNDNTGTDEEENTNAE